MPYSNGIFYIDLFSGSDTARTALTGCVASNPSGTITRINKTAHGLVTGAVVDLTLFSTWLNGAWKITNVDNDNFDLDNAVWQTTTDANGTVTPRGGSSWTDAWRTVAGGATASRIQPGDTIRLAETAEVDSGIDATFTDGSATVTLASALTKNIETADNSSTWTASANVTLANNTTRKLGANSVQISPASAFTTGKLAYAPIAGGGTQDFSGYERMAFYVFAGSSAITANVFKVAICSDATGDTIVNEVNVPAFNGNTSGFVIFDNAAALGSSIQSVAVYANSDPGTTQIRLNNIFACNDFSLDSVFGLAGDVMYVPRNINGTSVEIDSNRTSTSGRGWSGTTTTDNLLYIKTFTVPGTIIFSATEDGSSSAYTTYSGGWNTGSNTRTGRTWMMQRLLAGNSGISLRSYNKFENLGMARCSNGISASNTGYSFFNNCVFSSNNTNIISGCIVNNSYFLNSSASNLSDNATGTLFGPSIIYNCISANSSSNGLSFFGATKAIKCTVKNNSSGSITFNRISGKLNSAGARLYKCVLLDTTEVLTTNPGNTVLWSYEHDQTAGNHWGFFPGGTINWQTAQKQGSDPGAWRVVLSNTQTGVANPIGFEFAQIAVSASSLVTVKAWVKKDHATNVACRIRVEGEDFTLSGITEDSEAAADNTNWQELTITFTPTVAGVVPLLFESWYVAGSSNTYIGSITVTQ